MALSFQVDGAVALDRGVWRARFSPAEVRMLGVNAPNTGDRTVLLLNGMPKYVESESRLIFDPSHAKLLVSGSSDAAIFIATGSTHLVNTLSRGPAARAGGDAAFLSALPKDLSELGRDLLDLVRSTSSGELKFYEKSGRYVESPDNFWTIKPQPRDVSFRITVRGVPESFKDVESLELKPDQSGYSSFKVSRQIQLKAFSKLLGQIQRKP
jgi:hypothetical protein